MNDKELQAQVRASFDALEVPPAVKASTLKSIERARELEGGRKSDHPANAKLTQDASVIDLGEAAWQNGKPSKAEPSRKGTQGQSIKRAEGKSRKNKPAKRRLQRRAQWAIAACLSVTLVCFGGATAYAMPTAFVDVEAVPSIELQVNRFGYVIDATAHNSEGEMLISELSLKNIAYDQAIRQIYQSAAMSPYISSDSPVQVSVCAGSESQWENLADQSATAAKNANYKAECQRVDEEEHARASDHGMGAGRYRLASELAEIDPELTIDDCGNLSMGELRHAIDAERGEKQGAQSGTRGNGEKGNHGVLHGSSDHD